jgi:hypothetical protein
MHTWIWVLYAYPARPHLRVKTGDKAMCTETASSCRLLACGSWLLADWRESKGRYRVPCSTVRSHRPLTFPTENKQDKMKQKQKHGDPD